MGAVTKSCGGGYPDSKNPQRGMGTQILPILGRGWWARFCQ